MKRSNSKGPPRKAVAKTRRIASRSRQSNLKTTANEDLAVELYTIARLSLRRFGLTAREHRRALDRASRLKVAPATSGPLLRDARSLSALLLEWSRSPQYVDAKGRPRVLSIKGRGDTFETLARQFLPKMPLAEVIKLACATAEVSKLSKGNIALVGGSMVSIAKSKTPSLAHAVRQIDQLLETTLHNAMLKPHQLAQGRMLRLVIGVISRPEFKDLMRELRPQIADLLARVESIVAHRRPRSRRALEDAIAVSVGVYVSEENDWERAGVDVSALVRGKRS